MASIYVEAREVVRAVKNRFVPVRYVYKAVNSLRPTCWATRPSPLPSATDEVRQLDQLGYFQTVAEQPVNALAALARRRASGPLPSRVGKIPFVDLLEEEDFANPENPVFDFVFSNQVLSTATWYLNGRPKLNSCHLIFSRPFDEKTGLQTSQLWHLDSDDFRMLRVFLYLSEVEEDAGPFTFAPKEPEAIRKRSLWLRRFSDEQFTVRYGGSSPPVVRFLGGIGSTLFIDSARCFHFGSRCHKKDRLAFTAAFTTPAPCNKRLRALRRYKGVMFNVIRDTKPQIPENLLRSLLL